MSSHEKWMRAALEEAHLALSHGDVPIGAVAVLDGHIIGRGHNHCEVDNDPTAHAEMIAIRQATAALNHKWLDNVVLYCTLEPCCMCAGAMVLARLSKLVYATIDEKAGCAGSIADITRHSKLNHQIEIDVGIFANEATALLQSFFRQLRDGY